MSSKIGDIKSPTGGTNTSQLPSLPATVVPLTILCALALLTYILRIYIRLKLLPRLDWDDYAMTLAMLLTLAYYFSNIATSAIIVGTTLQTITFAAIEKLLLLSFLIRLFWIWAATMIKVSVTLMIQRIKQDRYWQWGLYCLNGILIFSAIGNTISIILACRPIEGNWKILLQIKPGVCQSQETTLRLLWASTALFAFTDIVCALLPLAFIYKIQRPLREKVVLALLMGLGLIAAVCGIMRSVLYYNSLHSTDRSQGSAGIAVWSFGEVAIGVIAANIPCLKAYLQKAFRALGGHITTKGSNRPTRCGNNNGNAAYADSRSVGSHFDDMEQGKSIHFKSEITTISQDANNSDQISRHTDTYGISGI